MAKKTVSFKVSEGQIEIVNQALDKAKEVYSTEFKNVAAFSIFYNWLQLAKEEDAETETEVKRTSAPDMLEDLCELGFLQKIVEPKKNVRLWHCLKNQRPDGKGKPILMADGIELDSISKLCEACKQGFVWHEQRSNLGKARAAIQKFGDMEIEAIINCCRHPANNAIQINLGSHGNFYCKVEDDRVTMIGTCQPNQCEYFFQTTAPLFVKETEGFEEVKRLIE